MIRAFLMKLLGLDPVFEVRVIGLKSGRDIVGALKYRGGYLKARKYYNRRCNKIKYGEKITLQAVCWFRQRVNATKPMTYEEAQERKNREANLRLDNVATAMSQPEVADQRGELPPGANVGSGYGGQGTLPQGRPSVGAVVVTDMTETPGEVEDIIEVGGLRMRAGAFKEQDHQCDSLGPMDFDDEAGHYRQTCSVCRNMQ